MYKRQVLDYMGELVAPEANQFDADIANAGALQRIARSNDVAMLVVSSIRKGQATFKPFDQLTIDDIAGAGRIAYSAQNGLAVGCEVGDDGCGLVHVRPLKARFAQLGKAIQLRWRPRTGLIEDLERGGGGWGSCGPAGHKH